MSEDNDKAEQEQPEELSEKELDQVAGGAFDAFLKLGDIKGEG